MNNTVRIALAMAYAAVGIWALMPTPPKPLAAATSRRPRRCWPNGAAKAFDAAAGPVIDRCRALSRS